MMLTTSLFIPKLYCSIVGHQYKVEKKVTQHVKEYKCSCCGKEITTNAYGKLVPLTPKLKFIHLGIQNVVLKRRSKRLRVANRKNVA